MRCLSVDVVKEVERIPYAQIVLLDGRRRQEKVRDQR